MGGDRLLSEIVELLSGVGGAVSRGMSGGAVPAITGGLLVAPGSSIVTLGVVLLVGSSIVALVVLLLLLLLLSRGAIVLVLVALLSGKISVPFSVNVIVGVMVAF